MDAVTSGNIQVDSMIKIKYVTALRITIGVQEHGMCKVVGLLEDGMQAQHILSSGQDIPLCIVRNGESSEVLFRGIIKRAVIHVVNGVHHTEIYAVTASEKLDRVKKRRSFQDAAMTYEQVVRSILESYGNMTATYTEKAQEALGEPIIQYGETDWQFLLRLSSRLHIPLYADILSKNQVLHFGMQKGVPIDLNTDTYCVGISRKYHGTNQKADTVTRKDYVYYRISSDKNGKIGDNVDVGSDNYVIYKKCVELVREKLEFIYHAGGCGNWYVPYIEHDCLTGMEFTGKVVSIQAEEMKVSLDIDEPNKRVDHEWEWAPVTGNIMYAMPEKGSEVRLYFGSGTASEGIAFVNPRDNGNSMLRQQERTFMTAAGKKMALYPEQLSLQGNGGQTTIADGQAITLGSPIKIEMMADGQIRLEAARIHAYTPQEINMYRSDGNGFFR